MEILKDNIDHYMELKQIKKYSHLLIDIAHELGIKGADAYKFAEREKSNFSKMLKGERPLKYEFIIPLEKIFGVSLARLLHEDAYKLPVEKNNIPFVKGFRYYAYLDNPDLYKNEFDLLLNKDGKSILNNTDEFGKTFLDYVIEYNSVNGIRYLYDEYGIKMHFPWSNAFIFNKSKGSIFWQNDVCFSLARLIAGMNDTKLFNDVYDTYYMFFPNGHFGPTDSILYQGEFLEIILDNDNLFNSMFETKSYEYKLSDSARKRENIDSITYYSINPVINNCLRYALQHLDKYKHRAKTILQFGIKHNSKIAKEPDYNNYYLCTELGTLRNSNNHNCNDNFVNIAIFVDADVNDTEINSLIQQLPKFNKWDRF